MHDIKGLRLLPWSTPEGKPCFLATDGGDTRLSRGADEIEALQLAMGTELLGHADSLLSDRKAGVREVRFLAERLCEALRDVLRVAESRGARLPAYSDAPGPLDRTAQVGDRHATRRAQLDAGEVAMTLLFFGKDPDTDEDHCPTVWVDDTNADLVFQGWKADESTEEKCLEVGPIPDTEAVIRIPARMVPQIRKACDAAERSATEFR